MGVYNGWGLAPVASSWLYSDYSNPYYNSVVAAQPAATNAVYDYSQPINVAAAPPDPSVASSTEQVFSAARDSFKAGDFQRALDLADQVLKQTPNAAVVHEFRALALFALRRYDEAASVAYSVLSAGPGWNWTTLVGLYPDVDTYTNQLRDLEGYATQNPNSPSARFLLAYHYMIEGHNDQAAMQFEKVTQLLPSDTLSASFVKALRPAAPPTVAAAPGQAPPPAPPQAPQGGQAPAPQQGDSPPPPPPPAALAGSWTAQPAQNVSIALTIQPDGGFVWDVNSQGQKQTIQGQAGFQDGTLILQQAQGPPLVGKVTQSAANSFVFAPPGAGGNGGGLVFNR
jgi:tetratricopeptide (TPR) repeat protein